MGDGPWESPEKEEFAMLKMIVKRSGEKVPFDASKIRGAIFKANVRNATEKMSDEQLKEAGVAPDLIRLSVGIENAEDILAEAQQINERRAAEEAAAVQEDADTENKGAEDFKEETV